ncbi:MAG: J domain-containing protein [Planctomycetes bacterium]|nr:J domain-containing protein [Planctomycetota bacterium]
MLRASRNPRRRMERPMTPQTHYAVLQVTVDAHPEVIKAAYRALAAKFHPDAYPGPDANDRMVRINMAYEILSVAERRRAYDAELAALGMPARAFSARPACSACGLAVAWLDGRCRICRPELREGTLSSRQQDWVEVTSEWPLRLELPLAQAVDMAAKAMHRCGLQPVMAETSGSDARVEAAAVLDHSPHETTGATIVAGFWAEGSEATFLRISVAASMHAVAWETGRPGQILDWWLHHLGRELEHCLDHPPRLWRAGR